MAVVPAVQPTEKTLNSNQNVADSIRGDCGEVLFVVLCGFERTLEPGAAARFNMWSTATISSQSA